MKRILLAAGLILLAMALTSCATKKHCDAYGNKSGAVEQKLETA